MALVLVEWNGAPKIIGTVWTVSKAGVTCDCILSTHPLGWELRMRGQDLIRSQVCKTEDEVFDVSERWSAEAESRGWTRL